MRFGPLLAYAAFCGLVSGVTANALDISSGCAAVTQYITKTVVALGSKSDGFDLAAGPMSTTAFSITTLADFNTVHPQALSDILVPVTPVAATSDDAYYFTDVNGTTSWISGISPPSTYSTYVTQTIQLTVYPTEVASAQEASTAPNTGSNTGTLSPIIVESTGEISTLGRTATSTITSHVTRESTSNSIVFVTSSSGPFSRGPGSSGWNTSTTSASEGTITGEPVTFVQTVEYASSTAPSGTLRLVTTAKSSADLTNATISGAYAGFNTGVSIADAQGVGQSLSQSPVMSTINYPASGLNLSAMTTNASLTIFAYSPLVTSLPDRITSSLNQTPQSYPGPFSTVGTGGVTVSAYPSSSSLSVPSVFHITIPAIATVQSLDTSLLTPQAVSTTLKTIFTNTTTGALTGSNPIPSVCGEHGNFTLTWDDEPTFSPTEPVTDPSEAPPVFNPYHHLYFSNGYVYMPPPSDPFVPTSTPRLVMFLTNDTGPSSSTNAGGQRPGEIGAGDRASESAFRFDAYSAYLGCDNEGPNNCTMQISGYTWQDSVQSEVLSYQLNVSLPACPGLENCRLQQVMFPKSMKGLSGIQFQAFANGKQRMWFMDNLGLAWSNNTCAAGLLRARSR